MSHTRDVLLKLLKEPTDRDKQVTIGASNASNPCARCLAEDLMAHGGSDGQTSPYWAGAVIGTSIHGLLEERVRQMYPTWMPEQKVVIGELPGYGVVKSTTDLYIPARKQGVDWKGLALDTPLPTPTGWTTMGSVQVGDELIDRGGHATRVIGKSGVRNTDTYRLVFQDRTTVISDGDHLWFMRIGADKGEEVISTREVFKRGLYKNGQRDVRIRNTDPYDRDDVELPIDPYVLGVWLGDGASACGRITNTTREVWNEIQRRGYEVGEDVAKTSGRAETRNVVGLNKSLRLLGVKNNKHVPTRYLRASYRQRLDLLRGYLDADGYYNPTRKRVSMQTTRMQQAQDVAELARSFGWTCVVQSITTSWQGGRKPGWAVEFTPDVNVFLARNQDISFPGSKRQRRIVVSIERVDDIPTQCVMVDSVDSSYLCTDNWLPTHNTTTKKKLPALKEALTSEPSKWDTSDVGDARFKATAYLAQLHLYGRGVINAGYEVESVAIGFVCRDAQGDNDIWATDDIPYDPEYSDKVWNRLERLWEAVQDGRDPSTFDSHPHCWTCNVMRDND